MGQETYRALGALAFSYERLVYTINAMTNLMTNPERKFVSLCSKLTRGGIVMLPPPDSNLGIYFLSAGVKLGSIYNQFFLYIKQQ